MRKKILWMLVSCLMVLSLVITSCGDGTGDEKAEGETVIGKEVKEEKEEKKETVIKKDDEMLSPEIPKYGGVLARIRESDPRGWDYGESGEGKIMNMGEELLGGDWAKGPAGTNENDWSCGFGGFVNSMTGKLAESWEMPDDETIIYHIRHGVHWWDKAPANGREVTAEDIAWNINRHYTAPMAYLASSYSATGKGIKSVTATDKWTAEVKVPAEWQGLLCLVTGDLASMICPDVVEEYGDMNNWENYLGTGAFMVTNYVAGSVIDFERNPDYWMKDPLHPENQLPYMDGIKELIISDKSTQLAAFRTGKVTLLSGPSYSWLEAEQLLDENPDLMYKHLVSPNYETVWPRLDKNLPFDDIRVRYAMNLAVDQQDILDNYYGGYAELLGWPYADLAVFSSIYTPLEEQSQMVQDMFGYDVDRAKDLMAEAGYPNGFKTTVTCHMGQADYLSVVREYLLAIGIDMQLENLEVGVYRSAQYGGGYENMIYGNDYVALPFRLMCMSSASVWNYCHFKNEKTETAAQECAAAVGKDDATISRVLKEIGPWELEQAPCILLPAPHAFTIWWPWFQNFYGAVGGGGYANLDEYIAYTWIDTSLKASMGY